MGTALKETIRPRVIISQQQDSITNQQRQDLAINQQRKGLAVNQQRQGLAINQQQGLETNQQRQGLVINHPTINQQQGLVINQQRKGLAINQQRQGLAINPPTINQQQGLAINHLTIILQHQDSVTKQQITKQKQQGSATNQTTFKNKDLMHRGIQQLRDLAINLREMMNQLDPQNLKVTNKMGFNQISSKASVNSHCWDKKKKKIPSNQINPRTCLVIQTLKIH